ncbi:Methylcrotonoyl-CoA carboxylase [Scedosporium apiospermum]|uniref:methylcrotonoyl-CoA carboxylase n=1 Tax=Pseudallescheria apiosperma TaxID=563466 RepID=A0A084GCN5_PSEDA|nr:Methylcrotonoyl-CoA carboxylase [Scedosporium apiospermum]KEZ45097.1 Methylcrotonoyl-CoA carboxylase [Scedosporium apiospermum]
MRSLDAGIWVLSGPLHVATQSERPLVANFGAPAQKKQFLPNILNGTVRFCLGVTEPDAGSDVAGITTTAVRRGDKYIVNGAKKWITNGIFADYCTTAVRTGGPGARRISALIIPLDAVGVTRRKIENSGVAASGYTYIEFDEVEVLGYNHVGGEGVAVIEPIQGNFGGLPVTKHYEAAAVSHLADEYRNLSYPVAKCALETFQIRDEHVKAQERILCEASDAWVVEDSLVVSELRHGFRRDDGDGALSQAKQQAWEELRDKHYRAPEAACNNGTRKEVNCSHEIVLISYLTQTLRSLSSVPSPVMDDSSPAASLVAGIGKVCGRAYLVLSHIPTLSEGARNELTVLKQNRVTQMATENDLPMIDLVQSAGVFLPQQFKVFHKRGQIFRDLAIRSAQGKPNCTVVFGSSTAGGAYHPAMSDYTIFVENQAQVFLGGPPLVKMATGEVVDAETLGGAKMHASITGLADRTASDEYDQTLTPSTVHLRPRGHERLILR